MKIKTGVPLDFAIESADRNIQKRQLMCDLCIYIPFLTCFLIFFVTGQPHVCSVLALVWWCFLIGIAVNGQCVVGSALACAR